MGKITLQAAPTTSTAGTTASPRATNVTVAAGFNKVLVVSVEYEGTVGGAGGVSAITYNSVALTKIDSIRPANFSGAEMWLMRNPPTGTFSLSVTMLASSNTFVFGAYVLNGVDQNNTFRTVAKTSGTAAATATLTITGATPNDFIIDSLGIDSSGHLATPNANQTLGWTFETAVNATTGNSSYYQTPANGQMSWTWTTNAPFSYVATAFKAAGQNLNNYQFVSVGDGMSASEKIR